jgi:hypothetical protein
MTEILNKLIIYTNNRFKAMEAILELEVFYEARNSHI